MTPHEISIIVFNLALLPVVFFSILFFLITVLNIFVDAKPARTRRTKRYPAVTIQVPSFNDPVAAACVEACLRLDYPRDKLDIMVLDDSTDAKTRKLLRSLAATHAAVSYQYRKNRAGYKPGALQAALPKTRGEIIVVFDADFLPKRDFLQRIVEPFRDPSVAIVQGRQAFSNKDTNLISKFASYLLMIHHSIIMPINNRANAVLFCGTAGAIRKAALRHAGGWNTKSITEDTELSVRILRKGYKTVYVPFETPSEVPVTLESFIKQQMRWCFGNFRVFIDNAKHLLWGRSLTMPQRTMILYVTMGNLLAPAVIIMTIVGLSGWFLGDPHVLALGEVFEFAAKFFYTAGFFIMGAVTLAKHKSLKEFPTLVLAAFSISLILAFANTVAIMKAIFAPDKPLFRSENNSWVCTAKAGNAVYT